jgi:hypothetical protein
MDANDFKLSLNYFIYNQDARFLYELFHPYWR